MTRIFATTAAAAAVVLIVTRGTAAMETTAFADTDFDALRWQARPVVVLGKPGDPRVAQQLDLLRRDAAALAERDMPVILGTMPEAQALLAAAPAGVDATAGAAEAGFSVLLIGKDGGVKARHHVVVDPGELTALVDTMPMRRSETRD